MWVGWGAGGSGKKGGVTMLEARSLNRVQNKAFPGPGRDKTTQNQAPMDTGTHLLSRWGNAEGGEQGRSVIHQAPR